MAEPSKPKWGSELDFKQEPGFSAPFASTEGYDLARDMDEQVKAHPPPDLARTAPKTRLGRLSLCEYGAGAAGILALLNVLGLFDMDKRPASLWIGASPDIFVYVHLALGAVGVGLALLILNRHWLWACDVVLLWTMVNLDSPLTWMVYGERITGRGWVLAISGFGLAAGGVAGAWAVRRAGPQPTPAKPGGALEALNSREL